MAKISARILTEGGDLIKALLLENPVKISEAFLKAEKDLTIAMSLKLGIGKNGGIDGVAQINYVAEKEKKVASFHIDEEQQELFPIDGSLHPADYCHMESDRGNMASVCGLNKETDGDFVTFMAWVNVTCPACLTARP